ncbi:MAG: flagellar biosynthesis regulator FlaF [Acidiphilium sp.]|nr:flagellar biosynthesis regulator FlaF [Acidiphilium sp.]MDD4936435.1 flagellar biosynthesis regulator FlaF [Acidiphilium sp.]
MSSTSKMLKAYGTASALRNQRDQDADVFRRVSASLRAASDDLGRTRAMADARRLWQTVLAANHDPLNPLPIPLRAQIISVANAVLRTADQDPTNLSFLADIADKFADGLSGQS